VGFRRGARPYQKPVSLLRPGPALKCPLEYEAACSPDQGTGHLEAKETAVRILLDEPAFQTGHQPNRSGSGEE